MPMMKQRILKPPTGSFFLLGPRGTGKSVWVRSTFPDAMFIDLLDPEVYRLYAARPERLRERIAAEPHVQTVVIDEIQKLPVLLEVVHQVISSGPPIRFVLTGSSARKLRRGNVNLLGGRASQVSMHPYLASEMGDSFALESALENGLVPIVVESDSPSETLRAYTSLYIKEEVFAEGLVRNTEHFSRFLEAISFSHGEVLTISNVASECGVSRKTVENYIQIMEDLMLAYRVPVFTRHAKRELVGHPKFYFFDTGVFRSLRPVGPLDDRSAIGGHALEGLVAQHLRAACDYAADGRQLYYWRTRTGIEVDFIVYGPDTLEAYEVKSTDVVRDADLKALRAFVEEYPGTTATVLYRGRERLVRHGITIVPIEQWMESVA
ncbi:MAG: ATP-binding protein [Ignavibacteria bacterium]|nr:ATP-binding protein [Ignavibacteria bacterium]